MGLGFQRKGDKVGKETDSLAKALATPVSYRLPDGSEVMLSPLSLNDLAEFEIFAQAQLTDRAVRAGLDQEYIDQAMTAPLGGDLIEKFLRTVQADREIAWLSLRKENDCEFDEPWAIGKRIPNGKTLRDLVAKVFEITNPPAREDGKGGNPPGENKEEDPGRERSPDWQDFSEDSTPSED